MLKTKNQFFIPKIKYIFIVFVQKIYHSLFLTLKTSTGLRSLTSIFSKGISFMINYFWPESKVHEIFPAFGTKEYPTESEQSNSISIFLSWWFSTRYSIMLLLLLRYLTFANLAYLGFNSSSFPRGDVII